MTTDTLTSPAAKRPASRAARRFSSLVATTLLSALLLAAAAVAGGALVGVAPHVELSDSMVPVLRAGDVVWLDRIAAREARVGDVVAFADPERGAVVLHRVRRVRAERGRLSFTTRGDANNVSETWAMDREGELGRYAGLRVPFAGRAVRALAGAPLAAIAVMSGVVLAGLSLRRIWC